jgi:hypothetical protein
MLSKWTLRKPAILIMENNPTLRWSQSPETSRIGLGIADRGSYMGLFLGYKPHNENCWAPSSQTMTNPLSLYPWSFSDFLLKMLPSLTRKNCLDQIGSLESSETRSPWRETVTTLFMVGAAAGGPPRNVKVSVPLPLSLNGALLPGPYIDCSAR